MATYSCYDTKAFQYNANQIKIIYNICFVVNTLKMLNNVDLTPTFIDYARQNYSEAIFECLHYNVFFRKIFATDALGNEYLANWMNCFVSSR